MMFRQRNIRLSFCVKKTKYVFIIKEAQEVLISLRCSSTFHYLMLWNILQLKSDPPPPRSFNFADRNMHVLNCSNFSCVLLVFVSTKAHETLCVLLRYLTSFF
jgi:hypothetical protein